MATWAMWDPVDVEKPASRRRRVQIQVTIGPQRIKTTQPNFKAVFFDMGVIEPDITSMLLLKAGDVERNPGPPTTPPENAMKFVKEHGENDKVCGKCKIKFKSNAKQIRCSTCQNDFHKTTCTEKLRSTIDKVDKEGLNWTCEGCIKYTTSTKTQPQSHPDPSTQEKQMCGKCNKLMRKALPVTCSKCQLPYHKTTCTDDVVGSYVVRCRDLINRVIKENRKWVCKKCTPVTAKLHHKPHHKLQYHNQIKVQ